jgi:hypothetical protein
LPRTGFLPEPIPSTVVPESRIASALQTLRETADSMPNNASPIFKKQKLSAFFAACKALTVEQAYGRFKSVFDEGLDEAVIDLRPEDVRTVANDIGEDVAPGRVEDVFDDPRLFYKWITNVVHAIANRHFSERASPEVVVSVPALDIPLEDADVARLVINFSSVWSEKGDTYVTKTYITRIPWYGRHVIRRAWVDYIVILMENICSLGD